VDGLTLTFGYLLFFLPVSLVIAACIALASLAGMLIAGFVVHKPFSQSLKHGLLLAPVVFFIVACDLHILLTIFLLITSSGLL